jgi:hypothetical protein
MTTWEHGEATRAKKRSGTYSSWVNMNARCNNPNVPEYQHYGARGIRVCDRWKSFVAFREDMGERPPGMSIDRNDVNGHYEPGNCKWSTRREQSRNTTRTRLITLNGVTKPLCDMAEEYGMNHRTIRTRLRRGWTPEEAFSGVRT